jgi:hypothetical protein
MWIRVLDSTVVSSFMDIKIKKLVKNAKFLVLVLFCFAGIVLKYMESVLRIQDRYPVPF